MTSSAGRNRRDLLRWAVNVATFLACGTGLHASERLNRKELRDWPDSPVLYLLPARDRDTYRALADDSSRQAFVERFWAARDPRPETPENEFRAEFEARVKEANHRLRGEGKPGWRTERGRVLLAWGPPDEERQDASGSMSDGTPQAGPTGGLVIERAPSRGSITWTYRRSPDAGVPPNTSLTFAADERGVYQLTQAIDPSWGGIGSADVVIGSGVRRGDDRVPTTPAAVAPLKRAPLRADVLWFPSGQKQKSLAVLLFALDRPAESATAAAALHVAVYAGAETTPSQNTAIALASLTTGSGSVPLLIEPGATRFALALTTIKGEALGWLEIEAVAPAYDDGELRASSLAITTDLEVTAASDRNLGVASEGLVVGNLRARAMPGNRVSAGTQPEVLLFVSGGRSDGEGALAIRADYKVMKDGLVTARLAGQLLTGIATAQPLPIAGLDPGRYTLELTLDEPSSQRRHQSQVEFVIE